MVQPQYVPRSNSGASSSRSSSSSSRDASNHHPPTRREGDNSPPLEPAPSRKELPPTLASDGQPSSSPSSVQRKRPPQSLSEAEKTNGSPTRSSASVAMSTTTANKTENDSDDESIEVLLTIHPPTRNSTTPICHTASAAIMTEARAAAPLPTTLTQTPTTSTPPPLYSSRSSAYLQCLAEMCHALLWDVRWSTSLSSSIKEKKRRRNDDDDDDDSMDGNNNDDDHNDDGDEVDDDKPIMPQIHSASTLKHCHGKRRAKQDPPPLLFAWERGDDLSVIQTLSRRYIPLWKGKTKNATVYCTCLFCKQKEQQEQQGSVAMTGASSHSKEEEDGANKDQETECRRIDTPHVDPWPGMMTEQQEETRSTDESPLPRGNANTDADQQQEEKEEAYDRCLNVYARLYFRKGPWFRLDDIYARYYLPAQTEKRSDAATPITPITQDQQDGNSINPLDSPSKFFLPKKKKTPLSSPSGDQPHRSNTKSKYVDEDFIHKQLQAVVALLTDMARLHQRGFVRPFRDEIECGKTVGNQQQRHSGAAARHTSHQQPRSKNQILRQEEHRSILGKLGGNKKKSPSAKKKNGLTPPSSEDGNLIWKQMCQQTSILTSTTSSTLRSSKHQPHATHQNIAELALLPVSKHVDAVILQSWASTIVLKASRMDTMPTATMRTKTAEVLATLVQLLRQHKIITRGACQMCLCLREAPLRTLRRVGRLYLCATSGPGDMRGDGSNAWRCLPTQPDPSTKDDSNSNSNSQELPHTALLVPEPGSNSWNTIQYPGLNYRFKLLSCSFLKAHSPMYWNPANEELSKSQLKKAQIFSTLEQFQVWELCVELRANVDYLVEVNELVLYYERKKKRASLADDEDEDDSEETADLIEEHAYPSPLTDSKSSMDFMDLYTSAGRRSFLKRLLGLLTDEDGDVEVHRLAEETIRTTFNKENQTQAFLNDREVILGIIGILATQVLLFRCRSTDKRSLTENSQRPWLRHLQWEGCLAYILWDIIAIFEKRGYYALAVEALETLLFGRIQGRRTEGDVFPESLVPEGCHGTAFLVHTLLSRRARGKAFERLVIDCTHLVRRNVKESKEFEATVEKKRRKILEDPEQNGPPRKKRSRHRNKTPTGGPESEAFSVASIGAALCEGVLNEFLPSGAITFCAARNLARRLRCPLAHTMAKLDSYEVKEIGHRFGNANDCSNIASLSESKYIDWVPITDFAVANAIAGDESIVGKRCSYIGVDETEQGTQRYGSLNVEELALEYYRIGRLPATTTGTRSQSLGGYFGWHDEGGKLRTLFRLLASTNVLGMDFGCRKNRFVTADYSVHLTPFQGAPFDLHVGAELENPDSSSQFPRRGFYARHQNLIQTSLILLEQQSPQQMADLIYEAVDARLQYCVATSIHDPNLERDVGQVRTLSMLAAGFGGKMLAAVCRCFYFDYRHYSGGLPDLTLVRAVQELQNDCSSDDQTKRLVHLGDWIGESFSQEAQEKEQSKRAAAMFEDGDEEFLGCSKLGDTGGRQNNRSSHQTRRAGSVKSTSADVLTLPPRLHLMHDGVPVQVECMLVEVKSLNDRLDARQEDWLNVLDKHGNARVCKFGKEPKKKK